MTSLGAVLIVAVVLSYPLFGVVMLKVAQPKRLMLARIGRQIIKHPKADDRLTKLVRSMLEDTYSPSIMLILAVFVPVAGIFLLVRRSKFPPLTRDPELLKMFDKFADLYISSVSAANPIFALVVAAEMAILTLVLFPFGINRLGRDVQFDAFRLVEQKPRILLAA